MITNEQYLFVARNWNSVDKKDIAKQLGLTSHTVSMMARTIQKKTGLVMRSQKVQLIHERFSPNFIEEVKKSYR